MIARPDLSVEINWTGDEQTWSDVTPYVRGLSTARGRRSDLGPIEMGTATVLLDNRDRRFEPEYAGGPYYPNVTPLRPIRIRATWSAVTYPLYYGYVAEWPQDWSGYPEAYVSLPCVDRLELLNQSVAEITAPQAVADELTGMRIDHVLGDIAGTNFVANPSFETDLGSWNAGAATATRVTSEHASGVASAKLLVTSAGSAVYQYPLAVGALTQGRVFTASMWVKGEGTGIGRHATIQLNEAGGATGDQATFNASITLTGAWQKVTATGAILQPDRTLVYLLCYAPIDGAAGDVAYVDNVRVVAGVMPTSIDLGTKTMYADTVEPTGALGYLQEVAGSELGQFFVDAAGTITYETITTRANRAATGTFSDDGAPAVNLCLNGGFETDTAGWQNGSATITRDTSQSHSGSASGRFNSPGGATNEYIVYPNVPLVPGNPYVATLWVKGTAGARVYLNLYDGTGVPAASFILTGNWQQLRHALPPTTSTSAALYFATETGGPAQAVTAYLDDVVIGRPSSLYTNLQPSYTKDDIYSQARVTREGGVEQLASDAASIATYKPRTFTASPLFDSDADALAMAQYIVNTHKDPHLRITQLEGSPAGNAADWPAYLSLLIGTKVTVNRRPAPTGTVMSQLCFVEGIAHTIAPDDWKVTVQMSPAQIESAWALDTSALDTSTRLFW